MKNLSFAYLTFAAVSAAAAAFSFYMVYLAVTTQSNGAWLFTAFGLMFSVLPVSALVRVLADRSELFARLDKAISPPPKEFQGTRFAPHWMMLIGMIVLAAIVLYVVVKVIARLL